MRQPLRADDLPAEFAVFPLGGALLLPRGRLPLNIFEPRYLALVEDSLAGGRMFGMVQPNPMLSATAAGPGLHQVGCLGRLSHFSETEDGRYLITLTGLARFRIRDELPMRRGYRRVAAEFAPFLGDLHPAPEPPPAARAALLEALRAYLRHERLEADWEAVEAMPPACLVTTLCMVLPFDPAEKQALLEAPTEADRATDLLALLRLSVHDAGQPSRPN